MSDQEPWGVVYGPVTPPAPQAKRPRDPYCSECGRSTDSFGGHHPGCPEGPI
jgi:hypothetical protein